MFKNIVLCLIIGIVIGIAGTGVGGYFLIYRPAMDGVRAELATSRADAEQYRIRAERNEAIVGEVKNEIDGATKQLGGAISTISDAKRKIREIIDTLGVIRKVIEG